MAFRFRLAETFEEGCQRIAREQIERAQARAQGAGRRYDRGARDEEIAEASAGTPAPYSSGDRRERFPSRKHAVARDCPHPVERARPPRSPGDGRQARGGRELPEEGTGPGPPGGAQRHQRRAKPHLRKRCAAAGASPAGGGQEAVRAAAPFRPRLPYRRTGAGGELPPGPPRLPRSLRRTDGRGLPRMAQGRAGALAPYAALNARVAGRARCACERGARLVSNPGR